jgi:prepilin-type N-terminal cleavage/methylation domain-containing protein
MNNTRTVKPFWGTSAMLGGFTLTELLVAVGVISLLGALTIPKVIASIDTGLHRSSFKDTYKSLTEAAEALTLQGEVPSNTYLAIISRMKTLDRDDTNLRFQLHNGSTLSDFTANSPDRCETILVDLNGTAAPNTIGVDRISLVVSWAPNNATVCGASTSTPATFTGGMVLPAIDTDPSSGAGNQAFFRILLGG